MGKRKRGVKKKRDSSSSSASTTAPTSSATSTSPADAETFCETLWKQSDNDSIKKSLEIFANTNPIRRRVLLEGMSRDDQQFKVFFECALKLFDKCQSQCLTFLAECCSSLDLKPIRESCLPLFSKQACETTDFWKSVLHAVLHDDTLSSGLAFLGKCLDSPTLGQHVKKVLENTNLVAKYRGKVSPNNSWLLDHVEYLIKCGGMTPDQIKRHNVARVRLFQRVSFRHFSEEPVLRDIALVPVSTARSMICATDTFQDISDETLKEVCKKLDLYDDVDDREYLISVIRTAHHLPVMKLDDLAKKESWFELGEFEIQNLGSIEAHWRKRLDCMKTAHLQYIGVTSYLYEQLELLRVMSIYSLANEINTSLANLKTNDWSRMAIRVTALNRVSTLKCSFANVPDKVKHEWANLSVCRTAIILLQIEDGKKVVESFPGYVVNCNVVDGTVNVRWFKKPAEPTNRADYVLLRRIESSDKFRQIGQLLIDQQPTIPKSIRQTYLGRGNAQQRDSIKLYNYSEAAVDEEFLDELLDGRKERFLIVTKTDDLAKHIVELIGDDCKVSRIRDSDINNRVDDCLNRRQELLEQVEELCLGLGIDTSGVTLTCESSQQFYLLYISPRLEQYRRNAHRMAFPFSFYFNGRDDKKNANEREVLLLMGIFEELQTYRTFELICDVEGRGAFILNVHANVLVATVDDLMSFRLKGKEKLDIGSVIMFESGKMPEWDALIVFSSINDRKLARFTCVGDASSTFPVGVRALVSLFERMSRLGIAVLDVDNEGSSKKPLLSWPDPALYHMEPYQKSLSESVPLLEGTKSDVAGVAYSSQFVHSFGDEIQVLSEYQNIEEAEFVVAFYQYLVLHGHGSGDIAIITLYKAQALLISDILHARCLPVQLPFPGLLCTLDEYVSKSAKTVIVSLCRTKEKDLLLGDTRRIAGVLKSAALSGLYIFGNETLFKRDPLLGPFMSKQGGTKLQLRLGDTVLPVENLKEMSSIIVHLLVNRPKLLSINF